MRNKTDVGIVIGGSILTILTICGVIFVSNQKIDAMTNNYKADIAGNMYTCTQAYKNRLAENRNVIEDILFADNGGTLVNVEVNDSTNVTITHNGEQIDDTTIQSDESVNIIISVTDDGKQEIIVDDSSDDIATDEFLNQEIEINGEIIKYSELFVKQPDGTYVYTIKHGDTLCKISNIFGYSVQEIAEYNHIPNVNLIYANSALRVPDWTIDNTEESTTESVTTEE